MSNTKLEVIEKEEKRSVENRVIKKELLKLIKDNNKLQSELKSKNETINSLINQNFTELRKLQETHTKLTSDISESYNRNIERLNKNHQLFKRSLKNKLKDNINTHYKLNNEKVHLLEKQNKKSNDKIDELQTINEQLSSKYENINNQLHDLRLEKNALDTKTKELEDTNKILQKDLNELTLKYENKCKIYENYDDKFNSLLEKNKNLELELHTVNLELSKTSESLELMTSKMEKINNSYIELHDKYVFLLDDNAVRKNTIDEKIIEISNLNSKIDETEKKNNLIETHRNELNIKITELINQNDNIKADLFSSSKTIQQLKTEKESLLNEKEHFMEELKICNNRLKEIELNASENIEKIQSKSNLERDTFISNHEKKIEELIDNYDTKIRDIKSEYNALISDRDAQIEGLTTYLKSITDNQYSVLNEMERVRSANEKLKSNQTDIDKKMNEIHIKYAQMIEEERDNYKREKSLLTETYNSNLKKSQEMSDGLQTRLSQTIEALGLSKSAISNLRHANNELEKQLSERKADDLRYKNQFDKIKSENISLRENLERSIELNNASNNREKQYEAQIKNLQSKYNHLVSLTKKNIGI